MPKRSSDPEKNRRVNERGETSTESGSIPHSTWYGRQRVDQDSGKPSKDPSAVPRYRYYRQQKVDSDGKLTKGTNGIPRSTYKLIKKIEKSYQSKSTATNSDNQRSPSSESTQQSLSFFKSGMTDEQKKAVKEQMNIKSLLNSE
ncbi:hypothetical protein ACQUW5_04155 [Legionella sp. CNM-1927-20]|uniref:hypothetical protein n=1 Tax=Legionella sp. CNM-1927-20 TaxID=3422221 RepID=UPI00403ADF59